MNPFFKNINIFMPEKSIFSKKNSEKLNIFSNISEFFRKIIFKISMFMESPY